MISQQFFVLDFFRLLTDVWLMDVVNAESVETNTNFTPTNINKYQEKQRSVEQRYLSEIQTTLGCQEILEMILLKLNGFVIYEIVE